jgi:signal transduction histidine kinase
VFALASATLMLKVLIADWPANGISGLWAPAVLLPAAFAGVGLILPGAIGALAGERARRTDALRERNAILERAHQLGDAQARMQERARIAGEMHDLLGHRLSLISLHAGALELSTRRTSPDLSEQAAVVRTTAKTALDELREVLGILKVDSPGEDDGSPDDHTGTRADVTALVLASQQAGVDVRLTWTGDDVAGLDGRVRRALHRVVREALTNVHKHAPGVAAQVMVERGKRWIRVEIRNKLSRSGAHPVPGTRIGLVGLQERVRLAGGRIHVDTDQERSEFVVSARLPLVAADGTDDTDTTIGQGDLAGRQTAHTTWHAETVPLDSGLTGRHHTMRTPSKIVLTVVVGATVLCCGGGLIGLKVLERAAKDNSISPDTYQKVQIGQTEADVRRVVGKTGSIAKETVSDDEPSIPAGATCAYAFSDAPAGNATSDVFRFCFAGGTLIQKQQIHANPDTQPSGN